MFKRFYQSIGNFLNIADIFGYIMVSLIVCAIWIGYQKSQQVATHARIMAKIKTESIQEKLQDTASQILPKGDKINTPESTTSEDSKKWDFLKYYSLAKDSLKSVTIDKAKNTVGSINESVNQALNQTIKDVTGASDDPRADNYLNSKPKRRPEVGQAETRDSLAPF